MHLVEYGTQQSEITQSKRLKRDQDVVPRFSETDLPLEEEHLAKYAVLNENTEEDQDDSNEEEGNYYMYDFQQQDKTWKDLFLNGSTSDKIVNRLKSLGFEKPSKIQSKIIPFTLAKKDVGLLVQAQNGSGKTLGLIVSAILRVDLSKPPAKSDTVYSPQVIILAPTVQICSQIIELAKLIAEPLPDLKISSENIPAHIVVITPESLTTLTRKNMIDFSNIDLLILEEACELLQSEPAQQILKLTLKLPKGSGLLFFSASYKKEAFDLINSVFDKLDLRFVLRYILKSEDLNLNGIQQFTKRCPPEQKIEYLDKLLLKFSVETQAIIFTNSVKSCQNVYESLLSKGHSIGALLLDQSCHERNMIFNTFKQKALRVIVTPHLLPHDLDRQTVGLFVNFDIPRLYETGGRKVDCPTYLSRAGAAGRKSDVGIVLNLYSTEEEKNMMGEIEKFYQTQIKEKSQHNEDEELDTFNTLCTYLQQICGLYKEVFQVIKRLN